MDIKIRDLHYTYKDDNKETLSGLSFDISQGEWVSIIGANGSGKSTLVKILSGLINATSGSIKYDDIDLIEENHYEIRKHIGIVFQNPDNQFVETTVADDIAFGLENLEIDSSKMDSIIDESLKKVNMLDYKNSDPYSLSGGQKQRVAIASLLSINPDILIFDEATSMLDPVGRATFIETLKSLKKLNKTIIMISHNMDEILLSDRTLVLCDSKILKDGKTLDILSDYDTLNKAHLEMPRELYLYHELKKNNYKNKEVLDALWELASKK